jgi:prephenate dehydratase
MKTIGIQGGIGSFNEEALISNVKLKNYTIKYLYTTKKVFEEIDAGLINYGQFAIVNKNGGIVDESIDAISKHKFKIIDKYSINIEQCLLAKKDVDLNKLQKIMSHPQGFLQCKNNLNKNYKRFELIVGRNKNIDPAYLAKQLAENKLSKETAIIGNKRLADIYNLKIIKRNMQDLKENPTTFLLVTNLVE